jgi:hypothetical protein
MGKASRKKAARLVRLQHALTPRTALPLEGAH